MSDDGTVLHAFTDDALGEHDAVGLAEEIRSGRVGRREAVDAAIARVTRVEELNAVQVACYDRARDRETSGPFAGVPSFVKDNVNVAGLPTCFGSAAFTPHPAASDDAPAAQFLAQGFALLGKSTLPEFGLTASTEHVGDRPPTRNPWHTGHSAGASSGGAGALVASGAVPIAHGNDGGGSIRIPAAVTGLVGLKVTRGRMLDRPMLRRLPVNLVAEGVLTRTVRDTAHYIAAAERYAANPRLSRLGLVDGPSDRRVRIGVIRTDVLGRDTHAHTAAVLDDAVELLAGRGHTVREMRLGVEPRFVDDFKLYWALAAVLMSASFKASHGRRFDSRALDPFTKGLVSMVRRGLPRLGPATMRLRRATAVYDAHFADVDVLLTPVLCHPAPRIGDLAPDQPFEQLFTKLTDYVGFTPLNNVGGGPAISVPHGMMPGGLPGSVQISAPRGRERVLIELAYELEAASPFPAITGR